MLKKIDLAITPLTLEELLTELDGDMEVLLMRGSVPLARIAPASTALAEPVSELYETWMDDDFADEVGMQIRIQLGKVYLLWGI